MNRQPARALIAVLVASFATACGTALLAADPPVLDEAFELEPGESTDIEGTTLTVRFVDVPEDSRCPVDVTCVWEGDGVVVLEATLDGVSEVVALHTAGDRDRDGARHVDVGPWRIHLLGLAPAPESERSIPASDYRVALRVTGGA